MTDCCAAWMTEQFAWRTNVAIGSILGLDNKTIRSFAVESGVATRRARYTAPTIECGSCLRLFDPSKIDLAHHSPRSRAPPLLNVLSLCSTCNRDPAGRYVSFSGDTRRPKQHSSYHRACYADAGGFAVRRCSRSAYAGSNCACGPTSHRPRPSVTRRSSRRGQSGRRQAAGGRRQRSPGSTDCRASSAVTTQSRTSEEAL